MADEDEEWSGPVTESSPPIAERLDTLEANEPPEPVIEASKSVEERLERLERIAEYLHDARQESIVLSVSVDSLAAATKTLAQLITTVETQQTKVKDLGIRVDETEVKAHRFGRIALTVGLVLILVLSIAIGSFISYTESLQESSRARCETRNEQEAISVDLFKGILQSVPSDSLVAEFLEDALKRSRALIVDCSEVTL